MLWVLSSPGRRQLLLSDGKWGWNYDKARKFTNPADAICQDHKRPAGTIVLKISEEDHWERSSHPLLKVIAYDLSGQPAS